MKYYILVLEVDGRILTGGDPVDAVKSYYDGIDAYCSVPQDLEEQWTCILREVPADLEANAEAIVEDEDGAEAAGLVEDLIGGRPDVEIHRVACAYSKGEFTASLLSGELKTT